MRWSQSLIPTMKETPEGAEIPSHVLMLRAGLIGQVMAGAYTYLPLGLRALRKAEAIVREEMDRAGAAEVLMPALTPIGLWERTGRVESFGNVLIRFDVKRAGRQVTMALGPTHEEVVTDLVARHVSSYRQLPVTLYQIQNKFRNEERPRFGVLRTSEFLMKDAYSFDTSLESLNESYQKMYDAYCRIFRRCGLDYLPVEAESGPIGGDASHEFMVLAENGEDKVVHCAACGYAANVERAEIGAAPVTADEEAPAAAAPGASVKAAASAPASGAPRAAAGTAAPDAEPLTVVDTPGASTIEQVSRLLCCGPHEMIKTLIYVADGAPLAVLIRGDHEANEAKIRRAIGAAALELAPPEVIREVTGAPVGFAGPVGLTIPLWADHAVAALQTAVVGANQADRHYRHAARGRDFQVPEANWADLRNATGGDRCPRCPGTLALRHAIEVGHVFKLGTRYSDALGARFLDAQEQQHAIIMGCYGIGVNRIIAALIETRHDEQGIVWPLSLAPFEVLLAPLNVGEAAVAELTDQLYRELATYGLDVLLDDRDQRPGVKFKDADLVGIPLRVVIGGRSLKEGKLEVKWRTSAEPSLIAVEGAGRTIAEMIRQRRTEEAVA